VRGVHRRDPLTSRKRYVSRPAELEGLTQEELQYLAFLQGFVDRAVHDKVQAAQLQTIAHALNASREWLGGW
jgi:hypothetical protein